MAKRETYFYPSKNAGYTFWRCRLSSPVVRKKLVTEMHRLLQQFDMEQQKEAMSVLKSSKQCKLFKLLKSPAYFLVDGLYSISVKFKNAQKGNRVCNR